MWVFVKFACSWWLPCGSEMEKWGALYIGVGECYVSVLLHVVPRKFPVSLTCECIYACYDMMAVFSDSEQEVLTKGGVFQHHYRHGNATQNF